ncbi:hypothetical protein LEP1GSC034_4688 [Leptospira interrogans str. 2003000735]|uniref:Uncharacterized protein n=5 Tax=Leptospira interrogans TaxID=173 RepID=M7A463_LEPIR|nr:hypothetical protein G436_3051 [Leptospira interrogans serovar Hardjo str. Norma]EJP12947.1 hypothetical protein LEP1GSC080_0963 [Leptospira interrogans str. FPW2026]EKN89548.1 hypothetical protein LEP1GSC027_0431 [Leptospira interrogans str. 2002000624]EKO05900.1 hypothetical protein LEP1GSC077_0789 [Leptospira interrogans str. C10069]EKO26298.1 hypothetical protein LEP1GSC104_3091 [Leptospira interrogans str. UI 12621]EKO98089.1 hypothetical protein LEP1GSC057_3453 [Leptospira interrogans
MELSNKNIWYFAIKLTIFNFIRIGKTFKVKKIKAGLLDAYK